MEINERFEKFFEFKGISRSKFEQKCGLSNGYTRNLRDSPSSQKLKDILNAFPDLNPLWLQTGEGEMIRPDVNSGVKQDVKGNGNRFSGTGNVSEGVPAALLKQALDEIAEQRKLVSKSQSQIDQLLAIIGDMQGK